MVASFSRLECSLVLLRNAIDTNIQTAANSNGCDEIESRALKLDKMPSSDSKKNQSRIPDLEQHLAIERARRINSFRIY